MRYAVGVVVIVVWKRKKRERERDRERIERENTRTLTENSPPSFLLPFSLSYHSNSSVPFPLYQISFRNPNLADLVQSGSTEQDRHTTERGKQNLSLSNSLVFSLSDPPVVHKSVAPDKKTRRILSAATAASASCCSLPAVLFPPKVYATFPGWLPYFANLLPVRPTPPSPMLNTK